MDCYEKIDVKETTSHADCPDPDAGKNFICTFTKEKVTRQKWRDIVSQIGLKMNTHANKTSVLGLLLPYMVLRQVKASGRIRPGVSIHNMIFTPSLGILLPNWDIRVRKFYNLF